MITTTEPVTLKKKDFPNGTLVTSEHWISNGHWAVRKALVKNSELFEHPYLAVETLKLMKSREVKDETLDRMEETALAGDLELTRTTEILNTKYDLDPKQDRVIFTNGDSSTKYAFDRAYVKLFDIKELQGTDEKSAFADHGLILMTVRS